MPEMFRYCGQRFRVYKRAHKTCDFVNKTGIRKLSNAVHLEGLRCDGSAHGGCQAECMFFWKDAWLKRVSEPAASKEVAIPTSRSNANTPGRGSDDCTEQDIIAATRVADQGADDSNPTFICQATRLPLSLQPLALWEFW